MRRVPVCRNTRRETLLGGGEHAANIRTMTRLRAKAETPRSGFEIKQAVDA